VARFERRAAPSPSFNKGWRLGVVVGASLVLLVIAWSLLGILGKVLESV
jgi:hypothetical protein